MNRKTKLNPVFWIFMLVISAVIASCSAGDSTPPAAIDDLSLDRTTRRLDWTATGDDGDKGRATAYDLRFFQDTEVASLLGLSLSDFNQLHPTLDSTIAKTVADNFSGATHIEGLPGPSSAGTPESFLVTRLDITGTKRFFFTLDVRDETGNNSGSSNVLEVQTPLVSAEFQNNAMGSCFGQAVGNGNFNGDLINDIVIGDPCLGRVYIFFGRNNLAGPFDVSSADVTIIGNPGDSFGTSVAGVGNIGGRSRGEELAIGAPGFDGGRGEVLIIFGNGNLPKTIDLTSGAEPDFLITGENAGDRFGTAIVGLTSIEGGSTSETVLVGAPGANSGRGKAYLFRRNDIGSNTSASQARAIFIGESAGDMFGSVLSQTGDLDGDRFFDFAVGSPAAGKVYIFFGQRSIVGKDLSIDKSGVVIINGSVADGFGSAISGGGDIDNGDGNGRPDLLIGAPGSNMNTGSVFLYSGSDIGSAKAMGISPNFKTEFTGANPGDKFGTSVSVIGDINPEIGRQKETEFSVLSLTSTNADFAVGAPGTSGGTGTVYVFFGRDDFSNPTGAGAADLTRDGNGAGEEFGRIVTSLDDITGDLINDFAAAGLGFVRAEF